MELVPTDIFLHKKSRTLEVVFSPKEKFIFSFEFLRVHSPSAEVRGHGAEEPRLVLNKQEVDIVALEPIGQYGIKPTFDDGHNTGIFSWRTLRDLGAGQAVYWENYLTRVRLHESG
jgi:DUF971 family protein